MTHKPASTVHQHHRGHAPFWITFLGSMLILGTGLAGRVSNLAVLRTPEPTLLLQDRHGAFMAELALEPEQELGYWEVEEIPWRVAAATVAIEDHRVWDHPGVDAVGVARAVVQNLDSGEVVSGASTITMQLARMQDPGPRTYGKKLVESLTALLITARYDRREILAHYLRLVPYGNRIHGIGYASRRYLDKPVADLSWAEVVFLAALPQAPSRTNPFHPAGRRRAVERAERILTELREDGVIGAADHEQALLDLAAITVPDRGARPPQAMHAILQLEQGLRDDPQGWATLAEAPVLRCSLDLDLQAAVERELRAHVGSLEAQGAGNGAVVVVDARSREVLASVGSTSWFDARYAGSIDYTRVPRYHPQALPLRPGAGSRRHHAGHGHGRPAAGPRRYRQRRRSLPGTHAAPPGPGQLPKRARRASAGAGGPGRGLRLPRGPGPARRPATRQPLRPGAGHRRRPHQPPAARERLHRPGG